MYLVLCKKCFIQATKEAFTDSWFRTGDIGYYDQDEWVYVIDRLKEIFKYFNNHVSYSDVTNLATH